MFVFSIWIRAHAMKRQRQNALTECGIRIGILGPTIHKKKKIARPAFRQRWQGGGPRVVNAYGTYRNSADYGADGHVWALDTAREWLQIWPAGTNTYCLKRHDIGTFTTFAGLSPERTGTVRSGVTGRWNGEIVALIHGTFAPTIPTSGFVGDFDAQCQQDGTCLGALFNASFYFSSIDSVDYLVFQATFEGGACGVWHQTVSGDSGDIVC
jgi:hypothetical protein